MALPGAKPLWRRPAPRPAARKVPNYVELHAPRPTPKPWSSLPSSHPFTQASAPAKRRPAPRPTPKPRAEQEPRTATSYLQGLVHEAQQRPRLPPHVVAGLHTALRQAEARERTAAKQEPRTAASYLQGALHSAEQSVMTRPADYDRLRRELGLAEYQEEAQAAARRQAREQRSHQWKLHVPGAGEINLSSLATTLATMKAPGLGGIPGKIIDEAIDLPAQTFLAGAQAGSATRQAIEGRPEQAQALGHELSQQIKHPVRSLKEAPLATALMAFGGENALARLVGRAGRTGIAGDRVASAFSLARPDLKLYGDLKVSGRRYNADPLRKGAQVAYERHVLPRLPGTLAQRDPFQATGWRLRHNVSGGAFHVGAADIHASAGEKGRRSLVRGTVNKMLKLKPKRGADAVPLIYQRVVKSPEHLEADLTKEANKLRGSLAAKREDGTPELAGADRGEARANLKRVEALLADKHFMGDPSEAFAAAQRLITLQKPFAAARVWGGQLDKEQLRAMLFPYAQAHMGARHYTSDMHAEAEAAELARGDHERALEVGGRNPHIVREHESLQRVERAAKQDARDAEVAVRRAENARSRLVGAEGGGRRPPPLEQARRAEPAGSAKDAAEARVRGAKERLREAQGFHKEARDALAEHKVPDRQPGMRGPHGEVLTNRMILAHMEAHGVERPGFMSHMRGVSGRGSFFRSVLRQPSLESHQRTGASFAKGIADHSWEALVGSIARDSSEAAQLEMRRRTLNRLAIGQHATSRDAKLAQDNFHFTEDGQRMADNDALGQLRTVHLGSKQIVDEGHIAPVPTADVLDQFGLTEHTTAEHRELGQYASMPDKLVKRLEAHDKALHSSSAGGRALQSYQQAWRRAKLNTSMPHQFGVLQEQAIRLLAEQNGPMHAAAGRKFDRVLKELAEVDKHGLIADSHGPLGDRYRELENAMGGRGGLVDSQRHNNTVRLGDQFQESLLHYVYRFGEGVLKAKPGRALSGAWGAWRTVMEGSLAKVEHAAGHAHLGQALEDTGLVKHWRDVLKMQDDAVKAMIDGRMDQNMADALARRVDAMMGNWTHQTPAVRTFVGKFAPFGLWWLNSVRWLYRLPVSHPIKTGLAAALYQATRPERNAEGQGFDAAHPVPPFLQGVIPTKLPLVGKVKISPTYYSPGGTAGPEWGAVAAEQLAPGVQSIFFALRGQNPLSGEAAKTRHGEHLSGREVAANFLSELLAGPTPFSTQAQTAMQGGGKPYGTANLFTDLAHELGVGPSQVKPGSKHTLPEVIGKMISPTRIIRPRAEPGDLSPAEVRSELRKARREARGRRAGSGRDEARQEIREARAQARSERRR